MNPVKITIYLWAGKKWFLRIRSECAECHLSVALVRGLLSAHPEWPVELKTKPWLTRLTHAWESLRKGGWHPPVIVVDGRVLRQGTVPTRAELLAAVRVALACRGALPENREVREDAHSPSESLEPSGRQAAK